MGKLNIYRIRVHHTKIVDDQHPTDPHSTRLLWVVRKTQTRQKPSASHAKMHHRENGRCLKANPKYDYYVLNISAAAIANQPASANVAF